MQPERKEPEEEPQAVASEPWPKGRAPLVKVEEATVEEGTPVEAEAAPGKGPWLAGVGVGSLYLLSLSPALPLLSFFFFFLIGNL